MVTVPRNVQAARLPRGQPSLLRRLRSGDEIARMITMVFALAVVLITGLLVAQLWIGSAQARETFGWRFFGSQVWDPVFNHFGALPFVYGTVVTSALGMLFD